MDKLDGEMIIKIFPEYLNERRREEKIFRKCFNLKGLREKLNKWSV